MSIDSLGRAAAQPAADTSSAYASAASAAARTLEFAHIAAQALASVSYAGSGRSIAGRPPLTPPAVQQTGSQASYIELLAAISELLGDVENYKLKQRLELQLSKYSAAAQGHAQLSADFAAAVEALEAAEADVQVSQQQLAQAHERVDHLRQQVQASEERLASLQPGTPEHEAERALMQSLQGQLQEGDGHLQSTLAQHRQQVAVADQAAIKAQEKIVQVQQAGISGEAVKADAQRLLNTSGQALLMRLQIIELLGESAEEMERFSQELFQQLQKQIQEHMKLESEKYLEELRKAEAAQKTGNCLSKILGPLIAVVATVVGAVVTAASAGALTGLAVALVGVALMATDKLVEHTSGVSFMGEVSKPLMKVVQEAIKLFTQIYAEALKGLGVFSEKTAQRIAEIGGMIAGIVATIGAVVLAVVGAGAVLGPVIAKAAAKIGEIISKMLPTLVQALQQAASTAGHSLTQAMAKLSHALGLNLNKATVSLYATRAEMLLGVAEVGSVAAQSAYQVKGAVHQEKAADSLAETEVSRIFSEAMTQYMGEIIERYGKSMQERAREVEQLLQDLQHRTSISQQMARNI